MPHPKVNSQFVDVIKDCGYGRLLPELDGAVREVSKAVNDTGGVGEIILKLKIRKTSTAESGTVEMEVGGTVATKVPKGKHPSSIFFLNEDTESLQREDPQQAELPGTTRVELQPAPEKPQ
jgi:hypothetical protein